MVTKQCKGPCGLVLKVTEDAFYFRTRKSTGKKEASPYCKACEKEKASGSRRARYATPEGKTAIDSQNAAYRAKPEKKAAISKHLKWRYRNDPVYQQERKDNAKKYRTRHPGWKRRINAAWHQRTKRRTRKKLAIFATFFPDLKLRSLIRKAVCEAIAFAGGSKAGRSILKHLPYTMVELRDHLESLWEPWMDWKNYGAWEKDRRTWQIDHVLAQAHLPYDDFSHPNFLRCWALSNLRPLEAARNLSEGCRR